MALVSTKTITDVRPGIVDGGIGLYMVIWGQVNAGNENAIVKYRVQGDVPWAGSSVVSIPPNGIPENAPLLVVPEAEVGSTYEIAVAPYPSGEGLSVYVTMPEMQFGKYFLTSDSLYNICGEDPVFLYSKLRFAAGVELFEDSRFTVPATGSFVSELTAGDIYALTAGVVGASIGKGCFNAISGLVIISNSEALCSDVIQKLYSDAPNLNSLTGYKLYSDDQLINVITGFTYVLNTDDGQVYDLDTVTGEIGEVAGACEDFYNLVIKNNNAKRTITGVFSIPDYLLSSPVSNGQVIYGVHAAFTAKIAIALSGGGSCDSCGTDEAKLYVNDVEVQAIEVQDGLYFFSNDFYAGDDDIRIELNELVCDTSPLVIS